jgi:ribosomal protein S10
LIDLTHTTQQTIDDLTKLVLPAGVDIEIKT